MALANPPRALLFDVFGTCVDWRRTVTDELYKKAHIALNDATMSIASRVRLRATDMSYEDWGIFAQQWRNTYKDFVKSIASDESLPWKSVDEHHLDSLRELLQAWQLEGLWLDEDIRELSLVWHRLDPWPDSSAGISELNKLYWTCTLSNGNRSLLADLNTHAKMDFTHVFSAEDFGSYKPSPKVYLGAVEKLGLQPTECAMVAAHLGDLKAARGCGLRTYYVERPREEDWGAEKIEEAREWVDVWVSEGGFVALAEQLGVQVETAWRRSQPMPMAS